MSKLITVILNPFIGALVLGTGIIFLTLWEIKWFFDTNPTSGGIILGNAISIILVVLASLTYLPKLIKNRSLEQNSYFTLGLLILATAMLLTNWAFSNFGFLADPHLAIVALLIALALTLYQGKITWGEGQWKLALLALCSCLLISLLKTTDFKPLFTDDHGPVMYRLQLLKDNFPNIPVFNSEWNAGYDWRDFFATGIFNIFFIFSPLIYLLPLTKAYALIVPSVLFIILPLSTYFGARVLGVSKSGATLAGILAVTSSSIWYKWGFSYGSMGFVCSTALIPLSFSLLISAVHNEKSLSWRFVLACVVFLTLSIFWSAQGLTLIPFLLFCTFRFKLLLSNKKLLVLALSMLIINGPWIYSFLKVSKVTTFVAPSGSDASKIMGLRVGDKIEPAVIRANKGALTTKVAIKRLREFTTKLNPILLLLIIPALFLNKLPVFYLRSFSATALVLFCIGIVGPSFKPQLELERLLIVMSILICIPVGAYLEDFISNRNKFKKPIRYFSSFCITSLILLGSLSTINFTQNKAYNRYEVWPDEIEQISTLIKSNRGQGRVLFSGFVLHEFGGGHIAPLPTYSEAPIIASSPVHNLWWYTDVIPAEYRKQSTKGIEEYLDLMNVSMVIAHEKIWKEVFRQSPWQYTEIGTVGKFVLFTRKVFPDSYLLSGEGKLIEQNSSSVTLDLKSTEAIVKFSYFPFLKAEGCESIAPFEIGESVKFISLKNCTPGKVVIKSIPLYQRLLL